MSDSSSVLKRRHTASQTRKLVSTARAQVVLAKSARIANMCNSSNNSNSQKGAARPPVTKNVPLESEPSSSKPLARLKPTKARLRTVTARRSRRKCKPSSSRCEEKWKDLSAQCAPARKSSFVLVSHHIIFLDSFPK